MQRSALGAAGDPPYSRGMRRALEALFHVGPLLFAAGFLWPLFAQVLIRLDVADPYLAAAPVALVLGGVAQVRGQWL